MRVYVDQEIRTQAIGDAPVADLLTIDQQDHQRPVNDDPKPRQVHYINIYN